MKTSNVSGTQSISGSRIHELRTRLNMFAVAFGRRCNMSANQLSLIEDGKYPVTEELFESILQEFGGVEPDKLSSWLKGETDELCVHGELIENQGEAAIDRLRQVFEESGLSQREFCRRLGVSSTNLSYVFSGKQKFTEKFAKKIESEFMVGADWLLYGDENAKNYPLSDELMSILKHKPEIRKMIWKMYEEAEKAGELVW